MQIGNRFRCYPTPAQEQTLLQWIGCQRNIYNAKVREDRYLRCFARKSLQHVGQYAPIDQKYGQFKTELTPYLDEVPSVVLRNGAVLWKQAYGRYFSNLGGRPTIHKRHGKQSVWLTSEVFKFVPVAEGYELHVGIKKFPVGVLAFKAHRDYKIPASLHISIHARRWYVSFNYDDGIQEPSDKEIADWLIQFDEAELRKMTAGLDRGVNLPLAGSDGQKFGFSKVQDKRLLAQERHKKRWQRRQDRRTEYSSGWFKAKHKAARYQRYGVDVRRDVAHKTSHTLACDPLYKLYVFEALKIKNMTQRAKAKKDAQGRWMRNGAAAKSGLNKSILASTWGQTKTYLQYKARRQGKLVLEVPPFYSSQECAACGHVHQDNRVSQSEFVCLSCGNTDHADHNAAKVIAMRGVKLLKSGEYVEKKKKRCKITRSTQCAPARGEVGAEGSRTGCEKSQSTPSETSVSRRSGNTSARWSLNLETPVTRPLGL
ncbi:MAG: transposase [Ferrovum myxofaciens]|nr:MAG: transposase [Ferrovum myxofaciens]